MNFPWFINSFRLVLLKFIATYILVHVRAPALITTICDEFLATKLFKNEQKERVQESGENHAFVKSSVFRETWSPSVIYSLENSSFYFKF